MRWKQAEKDKRNQPASGDYTQWKNQIAEECFLQCVYCAIHESAWGGIDHYHIDHFRPKSRKEFKHLINDILNLFYACPICNRFKSDDWPNEALDDHSIPAYPDPSKVDYNNLVTINRDFSLSGNFPASTYVIQRLYLNRPQLLYERREEFLHSKSEEIINDIHQMLSGINDSHACKEILDAFKRIIDLKNARRHVRPYRIAEIRRP